VFCALVNTGGEKFTVRPEDVLLLVTPPGQDTLALEPLSPDAYSQKLHNKALWGALTVGLATAVLLDGPTLSGSAQVTHDGSTTYILGETHLSPSASQRASAGAETATQMLGAAMDDIERVEELLLRATTLYPGESVTGIVPFRFRALPSDDFLILLRVNGILIRLPGQVQE
jgi:hypothetical protein